MAWFGAFTPRGYATKIVGKWHLGTYPDLRPLVRGFDEFYGFLSGGHDYFPENLTYEPLKDIDRRWAWYLTKLLDNETRVGTTKYLTEELNDRAVDFIERNKDEPFFLYLSYYAPLQEGKAWMYDGGNRVPWIVRYPAQVEAGSTSGATITSPALFPTLLELTGVDAMPEQHVDGRSFAPALRGEPFERGPIFWYYPNNSNQGGTPSRSVRDGMWKPIEFFEDARLELYDLAEDLGEKRDLAHREPEKTAKLHAALCAWSELVAAKIPESNRHYDAMMAGTLACPDGSGEFPGCAIPGNDRCE
ncbi:MAG: sulfatase/phosphatase domain-containing protein [Planctomycetota bacterium]